MGSSYSRTSSVDDERLKTLRTRLAHRRHRKSSDSKSSQVSEMIPEILEMIFAYFVDADHIGMPRSTLVVISRVNRHWARIAQSLLYRRVTITQHRELSLLLRTVSKNPRLESSIAQLRMPEVLELEPTRTYGHAVFRLSDESQRKGEQNARALAVADVLRLLSSLTNLKHLELHADNVELFADQKDTATQRPKALTNLLTLTSLVLHGRHDGRWLFLLKFAPFLTSLRVSPCWGREHTPHLPFGTYNLRTLHLTNDDPGFVPEGLDNRLTSTQFENLITATPTPNFDRRGSAPAYLPPPARLMNIGRAPSNSRISNITALTLMDIPTILPDLAKHFSTLSHTLEHLHISYRASHDLIKMTAILGECLPAMRVLQSLETNAKIEGLTALPPSLESLTISLKGRPLRWSAGGYTGGGSTMWPSPPLSLVDDGEDSELYDKLASSSPVFANRPLKSDPNIGSIYDTISHILDTVSRSHLTSPSVTPAVTPSRAFATFTFPPTYRPSSLSRLTITDSTMEDFLHFHLVGDSYSDPEPSIKGAEPQLSRNQQQNRMWMKAGQLGILIDVIKPGFTRR